MAHVDEASLSQQTTPSKDADSSTGARGFPAGSVVWAKYEGSMWPGSVVPLSSRRSVGSSQQTIPIKFFELNKRSMVSIEDVVGFYDPSEEPVGHAKGSRPFQKRAINAKTSNAFKRAVTQALAEQAATVAAMSPGAAVGAKRGLEVKQEEAEETPPNKTKQAPKLRAGRRVLKDENDEEEPNQEEQKMDVNVKGGKGKKASGEGRMGKRRKVEEEEAAAVKSEATSDDAEGEAAEEVAEEEEMTEYERKREENMKRNQEILASLSLPLMPVAPPPSRSSSVRARGLQPQKREEALPTRQRSLRIQGKDSMGEALPPSFKEPSSTRVYASRSDPEYERERRADLTLAECAALPRRPPPAHAHDPDPERAAEVAEEEGRVAALAERMVALAAAHPAHAGAGAGEEGGQRRKGQTEAAYVEQLKQLAVQEGDVAKVVRERVTALAVHASRSQVVVAAGDKTGRVGLFLPDVASDDTCVTLLDVHARAVVSLCFDPLHPARLYSASYDNHTREFDFETRAVRVALDAEDKFPDGFMSSCALDPARGIVYGGYSGGQISILDPRAGGAKAEWKQLHTKTVRGIEVHPTDSNLLLTASIDTTAVLWDVRRLKSSQAVATVPHGRGVTSAKFNASGSRVVTTSYDNTLRILDVKARAETLSVPHNNDTGRWLSAFQAVFDPGQEDAVVIGSMLSPRGVDVVSAGSGQKLHRLEHPNFGFVTSLNVWHPSLFLLAGANSSGKVLLWR